MSHHFISVIICTIRANEVLGSLIRDLELQSYRSFEVLIVGTEETDEAADRYAISFPLQFLPAPRGLAAARNVGLRRAAGSILCFLDDDVELPVDFLAKTAAAFDDPQLADVGGITGFDTDNYGYPAPLRWKLRHALGISPSLHAGDSSHLGRTVPLSFLVPFTGYRTVKWLPGFCQIFRRSVIRGMLYNEQVVVEDREFSMRVGDHARLVIAGDLKLAHKMDSSARHPNHKQTWRAAFGLGYIFASRMQSMRDWLSVVSVLVGEAAIDLAILVLRPSTENVKVLAYRSKGFLQGFAKGRSSAGRASSGLPNVHWS
jgi:glycosyltransferase involved in cell wall biosynthesis